MENKIEVLNESVIEESAAAAYDTAAVCEEAAEEIVSTEVAETVAEEAAEVAEEAAEVAEEAAEVAEEAAAEFDEDEEFVPPIVFADDYDDPIDDSEYDYYESNAARVRIHMQEQQAKEQPVAVQEKKRSFIGAIQNFAYHHKAGLLIALGVLVAAIAYVIVEVIPF